MDIDDSLVDSHLVSVPGVGSLTARRFSGGNSQDFGWNSDWTSSLVSLVLSSDKNLVASPLEWLNLSSFQCHSKVIKLRLDSNLSSNQGLLGSMSLPNSLHVLVLFNGVLLFFISVHI